MTRLSRFAEAARELRAQLDDVADVDWWHPSWWGFVGGVALLDALGSDRDNQHLYLSANGGPRADNYMGREREGPADAAEAVVRAVVRARAAVEAISRHDGALPGQPLLRALHWHNGWLKRVPVPAGAVAFSIGEQAFVADLSACDDASLAQALGAAVAGRSPREEVLGGLAPVDKTSGQPTAVAVAVAVGTGNLEFASHVHRSAWTAGGGPWLGIGDVSPLEVVTTCHVAVDGFGHALVTDTVLAEANKSPPSQIAVLRAAALRGLAGAGAIPLITPPAGAEPLSFAGRTIDRVGRFAHQAYAFGAVLENTFGAGATFQVPVAPGQPHSPERRRQRVVHGLLTVRRGNGKAETFDQFSARLGDFVARETAGRGALARVSRAVANAPLPLAVRRRLMASKVEPHPHLPTFEVVAGRGRLSSMRFPANQRPKAPLYAVSSPTLIATPADPRGAVVMTLIHHDQGCTVTASGTGRVAGDGAQVFLDQWCERLESLLSHGDGRSHPSHRSTVAGKAGRR